jgi:N-acylneuraminate cytidylyltransferase
MIDILNNSIVLIPARGGSKGVPHKNSKPFAGGKSLVERAIDIALAVFPQNKIVLSSDDETTCKFGYNLSISVIERDPKLASDSSGMLEVMLDAIDKQEIEPKYLILLQPTSPFRTKEHLIEAINLMKEDDQAIVAVNEPSGHPYYTLFTKSGDYIEKFQKNEIVRRQDLPDVYDVNGLLYIFEVSSLKTTSWTNFERIRPMIVSKLSSIDIDTQEDWQIAEAVYQSFFK